MHACVLRRIELRRLSEPLTRYASALNRDLNASAQWT